jgi:hypothetical protein
MPKIYQHDSTQVVPTARTLTAESRGLIAIGIFPSSDSFLHGQTWVSSEKKAGKEASGGYLKTDWEFVTAEQTKHPSSPPSACLEAGFLEFAVTPRVRP